MTHAGSSNRPARRVNRSMRRSCSSWSWACARAKSSGLPGSWSISTPPSCTSGSKFSEWAVSSSAARSRRKRQKRRCRFPNSASRRSGCAMNSRRPPAAGLTAPGSIPAWCSPPATARLWSRGTSVAASIAASPKPRCRGSPCTARGRPAVPPGGPGRASAGGDADPAAQQDRRHDGDLYRGALVRHSRRAQEARPVARQLDPLLYFSVVRASKTASYKIATGR